MNDGKLISTPFIHYKGRRHVWINDACFLRTIFEVPLCRRKLVVSSILRQSPYNLLAAARHVLLSFRLIIQYQLVAG